MDSGFPNTAVLAELERLTLELGGIVTFSVAIACHDARSELIEISFGSLHPIYDGLAIVFTIATEQLDGKEHILLANRQRSDNTIGIKES